MTRLMAFCLLLMVLLLCIPITFAIVNVLATVHPP